jgi:hypothetical protein
MQQVKIELEVFVSVYRIHFVNVDNIFCTYVKCSVLCIEECLRLDTHDCYS